MDDSPSMAEAFSVRRSFSHGVTALQVATAPLWLGGLLMSISDCDGGRFPTDLPDFHLGDRHSALLFPLRWGPAASAAFADDELRAAFTGWFVAVAIVLALFALAIGLGLFALNAWLSTGFVRLHMSVLEHASEALEPLFSGRDRLWPMVGYKLLASFSFSAAVLVAGWPGALLAFYGYMRESQTLSIAGIGAAVVLAGPVAIYVVLGTYLGAHAVVLEQASPGHALRRSFALAARGRLPLLGFALVCILLETAAMVGILLCCVGVLATAPFARALVGFAKTESFVLLTRGYAPAAEYRLWQRGATGRYGGPPLPAAPPPPAAPPDANEPPV